MDHVLNYYISKTQVTLQMYLITLKYLVIYTVCNCKNISLLDSASIIHVLGPNLVCTCIWYIHVYYGIYMYIIVYTCINCLHSA